MLRSKFAAPALYTVLALIVTSCATEPEAPKAQATHHKAAREKVTSTSISSPINVGAAPGTASPASPEEDREFHAISALYTHAAYEAAIVELQKFEKLHPQSSLTSQAENLHGLSYLLTKRPSQAISHFKRALDENGANPTFTQYLMYNLADAQFESGLMEDAQKTASDIQPQDMDKENRIKVHYLKARINTKRNLPAESARDCLMAGQLLLQTTTKDTRSAVSALLDQNLKAITDLAVMEDLYHNFEESALADQVLFRLGAQELLAPEPLTKTKGESHLKALMSRYPESHYYAQAAELTHSTGSGATAAVTPDHPGRDTGSVNSNAVGVLLPMKGKFAKFGARTLQGIELAFKIFNAQEPDSKITLVVEDSGEEAETTLKALNKLVTKHHVVAIIGPLLSKGIDQATQRAEELGVPLLSLSRHTGVQSDYVFQAGLTLKLQTREIARYAHNKLGIKRFAVVYPRDKVGEDAMHRFWDAVESLGDSITGVESYNAGETDFRQAIDRLSGLYYSEARTRELEDLAKQRTLNNIKKRTRKTEQYFSLKPVVDYDAVFIPEEPKVAGQILPTFAYRDVDHVKFLGTSAWNSPELALRAQTYAESAYFLDAFFPDSQAPNVRAYVEHYKATFNLEPTSMDALAYDAARLLETVLSKSEGMSRSEVRDKLKDIKNFPGVTGRITYQDGQFSRDLKILTTKQGRVIEAEE